MWDYGLFVNETDVDESNYPNEFLAENLLDTSVRNEIYAEIDGNVRDNYRKAQLSFQEAQDFLYKVSTGTVTADEAIRLLNYIFLKQFENKNNNLFGDLITYDPDEESAKDSEELRNEVYEGNEDETGKEILDWAEMEEEGMPFTNSFKTNWDDIISECEPSRPRFRIDCNEVQLKNRIKLKYFLEFVACSPYLYIPLTEQEQEEREQNKAKAAVSSGKSPINGLGSDVPYDEEIR